MSAETSKTVRFNDKLKIHTMCVWKFASHKARVGEWEQAARDRVRFKIRIQRVGEIVNCVLLKKYMEYLKNKK
jgi:hypothetical protein